ncbi:MAG: zinc-binding alcohol dehydrogenase family protein [Verrucomicrobiota bacterium]
MKRRILLNQPGNLKELSLFEDTREKESKETVMVRVHAASINPIDVYILTGLARSGTGFPYTPGNDFAGVISEESSKRRYPKGTRVWGVLQGSGGLQGSHADFLEVDEDKVFPLPSEVSFAEAAASGLVSVTAFMIFNRIMKQGAQSVLVNGAGGSVGRALVELLGARGVDCLAMTSSGEKADECKKLGALDSYPKHLSEFSDDEIAEITETRGHCGAVVEIGRNPDPHRMFSVLARSGTGYILAGRAAKPVFPIGEFYSKSLKLEGIFVPDISAEELAQSSRFIAELWAERRLIAKVHSEVPFENALEAFLKLEEAIQSQKSIGKIVLNFE